MATTDSQNAWFGVSMFLIGLIAGVILTFATGSGGFGTKAPQAPTAGGTNTAPQAPQAPVVSVTNRMVAYAKDLGLNAPDFSACLGSTDYNEKITQDLTTGSQAGINGTPGNILVNLKTGKGRLIAGARPFDSFKTQIDEMLKNPNAASTDPNVTAVTNLAPVDFSKDHYLGDKNAPLALVEYSDYQCPFCQRVHPTYKQILEAYPGKVVWVFRHFPLTSIHPDAQPLAIGAECANKLGGADAFWKFTDKVMSE